MKRARSPSQSNQSAKRLHQHPSLADLPKSAVGLVFSKLDLPSAFAAFPACTAWCDVPVPWTALHNLDDRSLELGLSSCMPKLVTRATNRSLTPGAIALLAQLPNIQHLDLSDFHYPIDGIIPFITTSALTSLDLCNCIQLTDAGLAHVANLPNLNTLAIDCCSRVTSEGLAHLAALDNLHTLNMDGCYSLSDVGLGHLGALEQLRKLTISCCQITNAGLAHLFVITTLTHLTLGSLPLITDAGFAPIANLGNLVYLRLFDLHGLDATAHIAGLPNLERLAFSMVNGVNDASLARLHALRNLKHFEATRCDAVTAEGVQALVNACGVVSLDPSLSPLVTGNRLLPILPHMPTLRKLILREWRSFTRDLQEKLTGFGVEVTSS